MSHRKLIGALFILSLLGMLIGYFLVFPDKFGLCTPPFGRPYGTPDLNYTGCFTSLGSSIGNPLRGGLPTISFILFILLFMPKYVYDAWKKFALIYILVAGFLIAITPPSCSAGFFSIGLPPCPERAGVAVVMGVGFLISSLFIIISQNEGAKSDG
jgi:hypothetical protein